MWMRLWPSGLVGRVGLVLMLAIVLEFVASTVVFERAELVSIDDAEAQKMAIALAVAARAMDAMPPGQRQELGRALTRPSLTATWQVAAPIPPSTAAKIDSRIEVMRAKLIKEQPTLASRGLSLRFEGDGDNAGMQGSLRLADGSALQVRLPPPPVPIPAIWSQIGSTAILTGCVLLAALIVVRTLAAPLAMLVRAADAIGQGPSVGFEVAGPREIRRVAEAFNAMQGRIDKLIKDRTEALAAVSHDLRTPIGRMKLRCGFLADEGDQAAFDDDLSEMEEMLTSLMAFLGGDSDPEKPKRTDLAAMLTTLVDAATDAGKAATYDGPASLVIELRSLAMKRTFSNLINNAIAYGGRADVVLRSGADTVVRVEDAGPGIPHSELASVFEPFYRVDASRCRASGGMGLGLSIARQAVLREGGTISLANRPAGGLQVCVVLPA